MEDLAFRSVLWMEDVAVKAAFRWRILPSSGTFHEGAGLRRGTFEGGSGRRSGLSMEESSLRRGTFEGGCARQNGFSMEDLALRSVLWMEDVAFKAAFQ